MSNILFYKNLKAGILLLSLLLASCSQTNNSVREKDRPQLEYTVNMPDPNTHYFHVEMSCGGWTQDTIDLKMPRWSPGYYQIMDFAKKVENFVVLDKHGTNIPFTEPDGSTWRIIVNKRKPFKITYDVKTDRRFVGTSFLDSTHAYIIPAATFLYIDQHINNPVIVRLSYGNRWNKVATGLDPVPGTENEFTAPDFDILYDCPILIGNLEELPSFKVDGIEHRFICFNPGNFNREDFMNNLKKAVSAGIDIIGDIPYKQYTFIGIGPAMGGIEHLNNTTVSFNGNGLDRRGSMIRTMNFLSHEYFHNYNVKRIRPYELGPFEYDRENRTNLLWVSEGLDVYYEYIIVKRAGLVNEQEFYSNIESSINTIENDPGRFYQSLTQSSYRTWDEGPFGRRGNEEDRSISYYDKGPSVGLVLDFSIRNATHNEKSLDDVMRFLYREYYKHLQRGFTDAEFQQACETIAGISLNDEFEYAYTTKEIDYNKYLSYAGLKMTEKRNPEIGRRILSISRMEDISPDQLNILLGWLGEK